MKTLNWNDKIANVLHIILTFIAFLGLIFSDNKELYGLILSGCGVIWGYRLK